MVDPLTTNMQLAVPTRGSDVGTWDTPVNGDFTILDSAFGSVTTIALTNVPVTLATSQAQNNIIRFTGTLTSSVAVTMTSIYRFWTIDNQLTNSPSSYSVTLVSTNGGSIIGCPPGTQDVFYDGTNLNYKGLGKFGEYWDYAGTTVPTWVTASTKPPWLNCDGTTFSSATYPILANFLGTTTLPDSRGSARYTLNQGTGRVTTANSSLDGNTIFASKTGVTNTLVTANLPPYTPAGTISFVQNANVRNAGQVAAVSAGNIIPTDGAATITATFHGTAQGGTSSAFGLVASAYIGGITMIRAA